MSFSIQQPSDFKLNKNSSDSVSVFVTQSRLCGQDGGGTTSQRGKVSSLYFTWIHNNADGREGRPNNKEKPVLKLTAAVKCVAPSLRPAHY